MKSDFVFRADMFHIYLLGIFANRNIGFIPRLIKNAVTKGIQYKCNRQTKTLLFLIKPRMLKVLLLLFLYLIQFIRRSEKET